MRWGPPWCGRQAWQLAVPLWMAAALGTGMPVARAASISMSPAIVDEVVQAGVTQELEFRVGNAGDHAVVLQSRFVDWDYDGDQLALLPAGSTERSIARWSEVVPTGLTVEPGAVGRVKLLVTLPPDAQGSYVGMFGVAGVGAELAGDGASAGIASAVYARVALRVDGTGTEAMSISRVDIEAPTASTPLTIAAWAHNEGDVHLNLEGRFVILDQAGAVVAKLVGTPRTSLPGQTMPTRAAWADALEPGTYTVLASVAYGPGSVATTEQQFTVGEP